MKVGRALHKVVKPSKLQEWKEIFPEEKFVLSHENKWTDMLLEHNATGEDALRGLLVAAYAASMEKSFHDPSANVLQDAYDEELVYCSLHFCLSCRPKVGILIVFLMEQEAVLHFNVSS